MAVKVVGALALSMGEGHHRQAGLPAHLFPPRQAIPRRLGLDVILEAFGLIADVIRLDTLSPWPCTGRRIQFPLHGATGLFLGFGIPLQALQTFFRKAHFFLLGEVAMKNPQESLALPLEPHMGKPHPPPSNPQWCERSGAGVMGKNHRQ